jgi:ABC-type transport system involved in multi-copper enzyme maturation permease subunit
MRRTVRQVKALVKLSFMELWRRNDVFALLMLALALMVPLSMSSPFGASGASRYLDEVALLLIWGFSLFIAIGTGARLFPPEFESRTIYPLLAKPIPRGTLLFGKYLGAVASSWSALLLFYALFVCSALLRGGGFSVELVQGVALHMAFVALAVSVSLLGSLMMTPSANLTLSGLALTAMFFFGRRLPDYAGEVSAPLSWAVNLVYAVGPHAEFFDMRQRLVHGWGGVDARVLAAVLAYAAVYSAACLFLAHVILKRKRV